MHNLEIRQKWDKVIKQSYVIKRFNRVQLIYILNKGNGIGVQQRDFLEKKINFKIRSYDSMHPVYYFYFSSVELVVTSITQKGIRITRLCMM